MKLRVKIDQQTFEVEVGDLQARPVIATIDGEQFEVWPEEEQLAAVAAAPVAAPVMATPAPVTPSSPATVRPVAVSSARAVTAPIPGTILEFAVKEGQTVTVGQELATLEAMKMKSALRANRAGTIGRILVNVGDRVNQGQALIEFTD